ncbi:MAG: mechanosensitive ion channel family protein [Dissulfurispiraceae bacterium]
MTGDTFTITSQIIMPFAVVVGGIVLGLIIETVILGKLKRKIAKEEHKAAEIAILALRYMIILSFAILSVYGAIHLVPMKRALFYLLRTILHVLMILTGTIVLSRLTAAFINIYMKKTKGAVAAFTIFINLAKLLVYLIGCTIILDTIGVSITPILTAMGVGGLAVALGLQNTLANLFSGLNIMASGKIRVGDYIRLSTAEEGYVADMTWRETVIKTPSDNIIVIPNSKLASVNVTNCSLPDKEMFILAQIGVSYDSDLKRVKEVTEGIAKDVMREVAGGVLDFEPFIQYTRFSDSCIEFSITLRAKDFDAQSNIQHELILRLHERYKQEGIIIPYPIRTVFLKELQNHNT